MSNELLTPDELLTVAEAILGAVEYRQSNLASAESVQDYAENACSISIPTADAERIRSVCTQYVAHVESHGTMRTTDYYYIVEEPLTRDPGEVL